MGIFTLVVNRQTLFILTYKVPFLNFSMTQKAYLSKENKKCPGTRAWIQQKGLLFLAQCSLTCYVVQVAQGS